MYLIYLTCLLYLPPMVVRTPQHFDLECASCHSSVQFFNIWTSKSSPDMVCSVHFGFKMRFVPQWRAIVRHADFQKQSEAEVFCTFSFLIATWLRTRRFSEPTFRPSRPTNHWKNTVFRDLPNVSHTLLFWLFSFPSGTLLSSTLLFSAFHLFILSEVWLQNFLWELYLWTTLNRFENIPWMSMSMSMKTCIKPSPSDSDSHPDVQLDSCTLTQTTQTFKKC